MPNPTHAHATGFKQSELGEIPDDWRVALLSDIAISIRSGKSSFDEVLGDFPVYGSTGILGWTTAADHFGRAILVARVGANAGAVNVVDGSYGVTDNTIIVRIGDAVLWSYVWRQLQAKKLNSLVFGSGQPLITGTQLKQLKIPVPIRPAEQHAIADALSDTDALIESLEQLLAKKRQIKQGAMQELLTGQRRLPGFRDEWRTKKLGEIGSFLKGRGVNRDQASSGAIPCVRYGEIYTAHQDRIAEFGSWISAKVAADATLLKSGDLLFAGSGETKEEIGKCVAFLDDFPAYAGGDIVILRLREGHPLFLGYALNTPAAVRQKASRGQGDAVVHISASALADVSIRMPDALEQAAIATTLSDMDLELTALEARLAKTRLLKQGMAQALLTGRIRLV